ncbi:hypothetical protein [Cronobacter dublinensis]|uniref:hypothetical protein n=1 Tax=Cronobacter dublinensis TaxID=413497 RepID=UPI003F68E1F0
MQARQVARRVGGAHHLPARVARDFALPQFLVFLLAIKLNMKIIKSKALDDYS